jgi:hypothetical protein
MHLKVPTVPTGIGGEDPAERIRAAAADVRAAGERLLDAVAAAREAGLSYAAVGAALGITRQAAWERFAKAVEQRSGPRAGGD